MLGSTSEKVPPPPRRVGLRALGPGREIMPFRPGPSEEERHRQAEEEYEQVVAAYPVKKTQVDMSPACQGNFAILISPTWKNSGKYRRYIDIADLGKYRKVYRDKFVWAKRGASQDRNKDRWCRHVYVCMGSCQNWYWLMPERILARARYVMSAVQMQGICYVSSTNEEDMLCQESN